MPTFCAWCSLPFQWRAKAARSAMPFPRITPRCRGENFCFRCATMRIAWRPPALAEQLVATVTTTVLFFSIYSKNLHELSWYWRGRHSRSCCCVCMLSRNWNYWCATRVCYCWCRQLLFRAKCSCCSTVRRSPLSDKSWVAQWHSGSISLKGVVKVASGSQGHSPSIGVIHEKNAQIRYWDAVDCNRRFVWCVTFQRMFVFAGDALFPLKTQWMNLPHWMKTEKRHTSRHNCPRQTCEIKLKKLN